MRKIPSIKGIYPAVHAKKIEAYFNKSVSRQSVQNKSFVPCDDIDLLYLICFTNRCGSNLLAMALASSGKLARAGEFLNYDVVIKQSAQRGFTSYQHYINWLIREKRAGTKTFGCKASAEQLIYLYNTGCLNYWKEKIRIIHITRDDVLSQAISLSIADQTKRWTSQQKGVDTQVSYNPDRLITIMHNTNTQNGLLAAIIKLLGLPAYKIHYESLVEDTPAVVKDIGFFLGLQDLTYKAENVPLKKQASEVNSAFRDRMISDYSI